MELNNLKSDDSSPQRLAVCDGDININLITEDIID